MILLDEIRKQAGDDFKFLTRLVEMGETKEVCHLDNLLGSDDYRKGRKTTAQLVEENKAGVEAFNEKAKKYHLYD